MRAQFATLALALGLLGAPPLAAQRAEIVLLGGIVQSPGEEFDRVTSSQFPPPTYTRQRGRRESGTAFGVAATFAIRGHVFAELGILHHGIERRISSTGVGDHTGPFLTTTAHDGSVTSIWVGPSFRLVDRERLVLSAVLAPALFVLEGDAYSESEVFYNALSRSAEFGLLLGLRARYWATEQIGVQLSVEDAYWAPHLRPHPSDGPFNPENYISTPPGHELRAQLGAAIRVF